MRLHVFGSGPGWHIDDLRRAAGELGHVLEFVDFRTLTAEVGPWPPMDPPDAVVVRIMPAGSLEQTVFRLDVLHQLHARGVNVVNPPAALEACIDKLATTMRLAAAGLPVPPTVACQDVDAAMAAFATLGGDVVVKPLFGSLGRGIVRITDREVAWRVFKTLEQLQAVAYLQTFIPHGGWDVRAFVVAGEVVAAMRRSNPVDWRTNVAQGATVEPLTLDTPSIQLAVRAAAAVGAEVAGVDLLFDQDGKPYVLEVNAVPGWQALARATGVDVAKRLVAFATSRA
jgi:ribosomal protein S6--L-glutamate ligase